MDSFERRIIDSTRNLYNVSMKPFVSDATKKQGQRLALVSVLAILLFSGTIKLSKSELLGFSFDVVKENIWLLFIVLCLVFFYMALAHYFDLMDDKTVWRSIYSTEKTEQHLLRNEIRAEIQKARDLQYDLVAKAKAGQAPEEFDDLALRLEILKMHRDTHEKLLALNTKKMNLKVNSRAVVQYTPLLLAIIAVILGVREVITLH